MPFVNCTKTDTCEEHAHGVCPAFLAGESLIDLIFIAGACPVREPYPTEELMQVRQRLLHAVNKNPASMKSVEELCRVRKGGDSW